MKTNIHHFGGVLWNDDDIRAAYAKRGIEASDEDIRVIREACNASVYGIRDAMIEAGWNFIDAAIDNRGEV